MRSTPRRTTLLRLVLGAAALAFGWLLLSMTQASADDSSMPVTSVAKPVAALVQTAPVPETADVVVEPVHAVATTVEKVVAPALAAPLTRATGVVRSTTTTVSEDIASTVSGAVDEVAAVVGDALPVPPAGPALPTVPGLTTTGTSPVTTPAVSVAVEDAVSLAHVARELASLVRPTGLAPQRTSSTTSPSVRSGSRAMVPEPMSPGPSIPGAPAAVTLSASTTASGGGQRSVDAAAASSAGVSPRTTPLRADGALLHPVPDPGSDPGSRPD